MLNTPQKLWRLSHKKSTDCHQAGHDFITTWITSGGLCYTRAEGVEAETHANRGSLVNRNKVPRQNILLDLSSNNNNSTEYYGNGRCTQGVSNVELL